LIIASLTLIQRSLCFLPESLPPELRQRGNR